MTLENLQKVLESLQELEATAEKFNWGPTCTMAQKRQDDAIKIVKREIKQVKLTSRDPSVTMISN
jgi:hypothetical protein